MQLHSRDLAVAPSPARRPPLKAHGALQFLLCPGGGPPIAGGIWWGGPNSLLTVSAAVPMSSCETAPPALFYFLSARSSTAFRPSSAMSLFLSSAISLFTARNSGQGLFARHVF